MLKEIRPTLVFLVGLTLLTGLVYPLTMTALATVMFPHAAGGSLLERGGHIVGSSLVGQEFKSDRYFHGRPSATTAPDPNDASKTVPAPYNAANSGGSNLGPTNAALLDRVKHDVAALRAEDPGAAVPADLVTTSGSGLDPDVSPEGALFQVRRVAKARGLDEVVLRRLVADHTDEPLLGLIGEPRVNVLALNLALDDMNPAKP